VTFDLAFDRVIGIEAGYVNNPKDPGGETKWGISKRAYPDVDVPNLSRDAAKALYKRDLWDRLAADHFPDALQYQMLDFATNSGMETAVRYLQRAVGVADDGNWGPVSTAGLLAKSLTDVLLGLLAERLDFMTRLSNWPDAGKGWARRIAQDLRYAAVDA
jgi:lysozyme family protein